MLNRKINRLYHLLITEKVAFEQVACQIKNNDMRHTVLSLAQQNNQYATELSSYMQSVRTPVSISGKSKGHEENILPGENGILAFCASNEQKLVIAYRKILKESLGYESLKKMLAYQLDGILSASKQLKLLTSLMPL